MITSNTAAVAAAVMNFPKESVSSEATAEAVTRGLNAVEHFTSLCLLEDHIIGIAALVLCICTVWAMLTKYINDGFFGKIILFFVAIGAAGLFSKSVMHVDSSHINEATLLTALAVYWIRHMWLAYVFRPFQQWYFEKHPNRDRRLNCRGCLGTKLDGTRRGRDA